ncbi:MAG: hypothetical protein PHD15_04885 [Clostridia bacterium]|nr:hypothetical protein [Clostridia bacterium]MDD4387075.1 hypothetical protein [Clostridia bacterium]
MKKTKDIKPDVVNTVKRTFEKVEKGKLYAKVTAKQVRKRNIFTKILGILVLALLSFLSFIYGIVYIVNETGNFTITLDPNLNATKNIEISNYKDFHETSMILKADNLEYMDNISESWLPQDIQEHEGPHNDKYSIGYTFFVKNIGTESAQYESIIEIISVIKNVDEAIRVIVYKNGVKTTYAKESKTTKEPESGTTKFLSERLVMIEERKDFEPEEIDKYTIVIWLEGDDPDCKDDILGGEMKLKMTIHELGSE